MRKIGYARVSSAQQDLDRQIGALNGERCDVIFREKVSGKSMRNRPQLERAIDALGTGDVLVVAEWDRATRSMINGVTIIDRILKRGALLKVLDKPHLDLTSAINRRVDCLPLGASRGRAATDSCPLCGRQERRPKLNEEQRQEARRRLAEGESARSIGKILGVHHATVLAAA